MPLQSCFQWRIAVNWNGNARVLTSFSIDMMATIDAFLFPAPGFEELAEFLAADCFQTAISMTLSFSDTEMS
jgi:hypothetical protein